MIRKLLLLVGVLILGLVVIVLVQPKNYHVERTAVIEAPPEEVFAHINDPEAWQDWSPWAKIDPNAKVTFEGPESGKGAKFHWDGNDEIGKGTMTIIESKPNELVRYQLDFKAPMEGTCTSDMILRPTNEGKTSLTWTMDGENNFIGKAMCLVMNMDKMVGEKYEEGFANLNKVVKGETPASTDKPDTTPATKPTPDTKPAPKPNTPETKLAPKPTTPETKPAPKPTTPEPKPAPKPTTPETKPAPKPTTPETKPATKSTAKETKPTAKSTNPSK